MDAMTPAERERVTTCLPETRRQVIGTVQNLSPPGSSSAWALSKDSPSR